MSHKQPYTYTGGKRTSSDPKYQQDIPVVGVALVVEKVEFNGHELRTPAARETHTLAARALKTMGLG